MLYQNASLTKYWYRFTLFSHGSNRHLGSARAPHLYSGVCSNLNKLVKLTCWYLVVRFLGLISQDNKAKYEACFGACIFSSTFNVFYASFFIILDSFRFYFIDGLSYNHDTWSTYLTRFFLDLGKKCFDSINGRFSVHLQVQTFYGKKMNVVNNWTHEYFFCGC